MDASNDLHRELETRTSSGQIGSSLDQGRIPVVRPAEHAAIALAEFDREIEERSSARLYSEMLRNAEVLVSYREHAAAQNVLRHILASNSRDSAAISLMAKSLEQSGRLDQALKCRRILARLEPTIDNKIDLAGLFYQIEDDTASLATYSEVLLAGSVPETRLFEIYKNVGNIHVRRGDFEAAEEFYNKAFVLEPKSDALMVNFGTLEVQRDNIEAATERFRSAVDLNSGNDRAWVGLALVHRAKGDFELSWGNLERALDLAPSNRTAMKLLVEWAVRDGRVSSAIARLQNHIDRDQEDAEMAFALAKCLTLLGRLSEALLECERVVALDPDQEEAYRLRQVLAERIVAESSAGTES